MASEPMEMPSERLLGALADELSGARGISTIQGFLYADHHVIRDVGKPWKEQEIWRRYGPADRYDEVHAEMMRQIEIERLRKAFGRAIVALSYEDAASTDTHEGGDAGRSVLSEDRERGNRDA